jgi:hypothetical protein
MVTVVFGIAVALIAVETSFMVFVAFSLVGVGITIATGAVFGGLMWYLHKLSEGPIQELKIVVDLPGVDVKVAPLILNYVDASLLAYLLKKCTVTNDHGRILLNYRRRGEIYDSNKRTFTIKGATYMAEKLKVLYCH